MSTGARDGAGGIEDSLDDLYEHAPCGYLSTTVDGVVVRVNATLLTWTGYGREDLLGRDLVSCFQPGSQLLFETRFRSVLHLHGEAREVALSLRAADGGRLPVLINGALVSREDGRPRVVRVAVFDARQRQEYERELLAARRLAESSEARVRVLQSASSTFAAATTEVALADRLAGGARDALAAAHVSVHLLDDAGAPRLMAGPPLLGSSADAGLESAVLGGPQPSVLHRRDAATRSPALAAAMRRARTETLATVPLEEDGRRLGMLVLAFGRVRELDRSDVELLEALALQAAHVLTRIGLQRQLERLALYDQLTGLASRRLVHRLLADALDAAPQHERALALLFVDLDGFKTINDELGHRAGDDALREVATRLTAAVRQGDAVGRLGGDEFVVVCQDVGAEGAAQIAERLHLAVQAPLDGAARGARVTCSLGVALFSAGDPPVPEAMIERADAAMYRSKREGRNRTTTVVMHDGPGGR